MLFYLHIKDPLLLIEKSSPCSGGSGFPLTLSQWSFTICPGAGCSSVDSVPAFEAVGRRIDPS